MENQQLISLISKRISAELDWSSRVDECNKNEMVEEVIDAFIKIMNASILNIVD